MPIISSANGTGGRRDTDILRSHGPTLKTNSSLQSTDISQGSRIQVPGLDASPIVGYEMTSFAGCSSELINVD